MTKSKKKSAPVIDNDVAEAEVVGEVAEALDAEGIKKELIQVHIDLLNESADFITPAELIEGLNNHYKN